MDVVMLRQAGRPVKEDGISGISTGGGESAKLPETRWVEW
jgi:hypothetical protein